MNVLFVPAPTIEKSGHSVEEFLGRLSALAPGMTIVRTVGEEAPERLASARRGQVFLGPKNGPGRAPCMECLRHWLETAWSDVPITAPDAASDATQPTEREVAALAELLREGDESAVLRMIDTETGKRSAHAIFPLQDCAHCGPLTRDKHYEMEIHCSPVTGIVRSLKVTQGYSAGAYRAAALWASALPKPGARALLGTQDSYGRGHTPEEAIAGCIGEALERYSTIYRGTEELVRARLADADGAIDPRSILLYSERQYQAREEWNSRCEERFAVGERFDAARRIDWMKARDLASGDKALAPAACCLMWYEFPRGEPEYAMADSIGCGSGRTITDATLQALCEWIERDAMAIWWYNRIRRPGVRLESFEDPRLLLARESLRRMGRELWLLDVTTDIGIPAYISVAARTDGSEPVFSGAAHVSPRVAAWKAASEVGQLWFSPWMEGHLDSEVLEWVKHATAESQPYLAPNEYVDAPAEPELGPAQAQVEEIVARMVKVGLRPYGVDLSRPDVLLKTIRAIVPGMRHIWNRKAPGRLYSVPLKLGWLRAPLTEDELNPTCCMI